ncbi:hypothetical protein [Streptomyces agglomeratus]|uniref:hypothetical protein n=1 Tax=Streptomyces agglomeratus TaxID=285458 RepID=UPI00114CF736|nr:hypothetical protein [Streptomyces agglomeratus]
MNSFNGSDGPLHPAARLDAYWLDRTAHEPELCRHCRTLFEPPPEAPQSAASYLMTSLATLTVLAALTVTFAGALPR